MSMQYMQHMQQNIAYTLTYIVMYVKVHFTL